MKKLVSALRRHPFRTFGVLALLAAGVVACVPQLRWREEVLALHVAGRIPDIELGEVVAFMMPDSEQSMTRLIETLNPHAVIKNFHVSADDVAAGSELYRAKCAICHSPDGSGGPGGPALKGREFKHGDGDWAIYRTIRLGVPQTEMTPHALAPTQLWQLVAFVRSLDTQVASTRIPTSVPVPKIFVPAADIAAVVATGDDWLTYSGSLKSMRYSALADITPANVSSLGLRWQYQFEGQPGKVETSPLARAGTLFITVPPERVIAVNGTTGQRIWQAKYVSPGNAAGGEFGVAVNRGVAILEDRIFVGTGDAHLIARSATTGKELWNVATSNDPRRYFISSAPLAFGDMVVTGVGTKGGGIAYVAAFDARTGKERWRFLTIPGPNEPGHETWAGDSWREGGAPTWLSGSYDAAHDLLIWGVGNPKPDYDAAPRAGSDLYSNCVIALQASTGKLKWYFQFTPADDHDWDSNQVPVLYDSASTGGGPEQLLLWANRNGFYYVLDRVSGKFLRATPFVRQT